MPPVLNLRGHHADINLSSIFHSDTLIKLLCCWLNSLTAALNSHYGSLSLIFLSCQIAAITFWYSLNLFLPVYLLKSGDGMMLPQVLGTASSGSFLDTCAHSSHPLQSATKSSCSYHNTHPYQELFFTKMLSLRSSLYCTLFCHGFIEKLLKTKWFKDIFRKIPNNFMTCWVYQEKCPFFSWGYILIEDWIGKFPCLLSSSITPYIENFIPGEILFKQIINVFPRFGISMTFDPM